MKRVRNHCNTVYCITTWYMIWQTTIIIYWLPGNQPKCQPPTMHLVMWLCSRSLEWSHWQLCYKRHIWSWWFTKSNLLHRTSVHFSSQSSHFLNECISIISGTDASSYNALPANAHTVCIEEFLQNPCFIGLKNII